MELMTNFIRFFLLGLFYTGPLILFLMAIITLIGQVIGKWEGWSKIDSFYYSFITATTVGYGDFLPRTSASKIAAIIIAFLGLLLTGIVVSVGLKAASVAFSELYDVAVIFENHT